MSKWEKRIGIFVWITLVFSIGFSVFKIIVTPDVLVGDNVHVRSDYVLMLVQCLLGLFVFGLPNFLERKWKFDMPDYMTISYFVFLYCAIYLGEVHNFYHVIPYWDNILHSFSGGMLSAFGFSLVNILNKSDKIHLELSPGFICLFAFCFAVMIGAIWEIYEFLGDGLLGLNMQKFKLADGTLLVGHDALKDTMYDIIIDSVSALVVVIIGYLTMFKKGK